MTWLKLSTMKPRSGKRVRISACSCGTVILEAAATSENTVAAVGLVEPESENIELSCSVSGRVTGLYVQAGDHVKHGQRLFTVDDRDIAAELGVKRAALALAQAKLQ